MQEEEKRKFIRNLWFLMLYASDNFDYIEKNHHSSKEENPDRLADLIAKILTETVQLRLKRNLNASYQPRQEILKRVRGRIDLFKTERRQLLQKAQVACRFEELTIDTPRNRFVRDALDKIALHVSDPMLANRCRSQALTLRRAGVIGAAPPRKQMENQRYGRNDKNDKKMIFAALLAFDLALPDESAGFNELFSPDYKKGKLHDLYEAAIAGFYKKVLKGWTVKPQKRIYWEITKTDTEARNFLPIMIPDIILHEKNGERNIVIDTKFRDILVKDTRYPERRKFNRDSVFQIYAYLGSQKGQDESPLKDKAEGLLLYPTLSDEVDEIFPLQEFPVRFVTVNFLADERTIRKKLKEVIESSTS